MDHEPESRTEPFTIDELFFSTTDEKGFIQSSNDVFVRVSRYGVEELLGRPHNIVRHPDMPRVVFRLLWSRLQAGLGVGAYVLNRAKDGSPYWVYAMARPVDDCYLSVRLKPTTDIFGTVQDLYRELLAVEAGIEEGPHYRSEAMDASAAVLTERLHALGFADYEAFMQLATVAEVQARRAIVTTAETSGSDAVVSARSGSGSGAGSGSGGGTGGDSGRDDNQASYELARFLDGQLDAVESYLALNQGLSERSDTLTSLATETSLLGFNLKAASTRLGGDGAPLQVLAGLIQETGVGLVERARLLTERLDTTRGALQQVGFLVSVTSLQNDMARQLVDEVGQDGQAADNIALMNGCLQGDLDGVLGTLATIEHNLAAANDLAHDLERSLRMLGAVLSSGRVEASRTKGADQFIALFERAQELVEAGLEGARYVASSVEMFLRTRQATRPPLVTGSMR